MLVSGRLDALAEAGERTAGCGQLPAGAQTLQKQLYPQWVLHGSLTAGNKDTVCEGISMKTPPLPVVRGR